MKTLPMSQLLPPLIVAVFLILTALGNAHVMFFAALLGVGVALVVLRHSAARSTVWILLVSAATAALIAVALLLR
jgi:hypothetical protein